MPLLKLDTPSKGKKTTAAWHARSIQNVKLTPTLLIAFLVLPHATSRAAARTKPNIIFILVEDSGLGGVSCCGMDSHKTPNIEKLALSGTRFEKCYVATAINQTVFVMPSQPPPGRWQKSKYP